MDLSNDLEDDDDTHICLKCHTTIIGLDNYVSHRKNVRCKRKITETLKSEISIDPVVPTELPEYPLRADDFFSSLELQSSAKIAPSPRPPPGILTRSKTSAAILANSSQKELNERGNEWIGGHQLKVSGSDNHAKLIKAVDNISGNTIHKKEIHSTYQYDLDVDNFKNEIDSNDDYDDDEDEEDEDEDVPPRTHTGGKWKPRSSPIQWSGPSSSHVQSHDDLVGNDWYQNPPPSFTGGKWKPSLLGPAPIAPRRYDQDENNELSEDDENENKNTAPPPYHTKGKWIPGRQNEQMRKSYSQEKEMPSMLQYWCGLCNRMLASKTFYERHLKSNLHRKRCKKENELDSMYFEHAEKEVRPKRTRKAPKMFDEDIWDTDYTKTKKKNENIDFTEIRKVDPIIKCDVCRAKVHLHLIGKHLISHFHCRKGDRNHPMAMKMVLDNIHSVVFQSPFQCHPCRFYCNTQNTFMMHWSSESHLNCVEKTEGIYSCTFCNFECESTFHMFDHLQSEAHQEVVSVINRSMPIVIHKRSILHCNVCSQQFRYNIQLKQHCIKEGHVDHQHVAGKITQQKFECSECKSVFGRAIALQKHLHKRHSVLTYVCYICSLNFETSKAAKKHRSTLTHKYNAILKRIEKGLPVEDPSRNCMFCSKKFQHILELKKHISEDHPNQQHKCPQCGQIFALSQEVSAHIRSCKFGLLNEISSQNSNMFKCSKCSYKTNSQSDLIFHGVLHDSVDSSNVIKTGTMKKYKCPMCPKIFRKASLRCHLRKHTSERPYTCDVCHAGFIRRYNLMEHKKNLHKDQGLCDELKDDYEDRPFLCATCGASFKRKQILQQHMTVHLGKTFRCPHPNCIHTARTAAELRVHMPTHDDQRIFPCHVCSYIAKTKQQLRRHLLIHEDSKSHSCPHCSFSTRLASALRRHMRLHTGAKPYKCPHCSYTCNSLENLRKHVLSTSKHPGKHMYECKLCAIMDEEGDGDNVSKIFSTNLAKEFRVHLLREHPDRFKNDKDAASYAAGIYDALSDPKETQEPIAIKVRGTSVSKRKFPKENKPTKKQELFVATIVPTLQQPSTSSSNTYYEVVTKDDKDGRFNNPIMCFEMVHSDEKTIEDSKQLEKNPLMYTETVSSQDKDEDIGQSPTMCYEIISSKDNVVFFELPSNDDAWKLEGCYDVEQSGTLVPFHSEEEHTIIEEHSS